MATYLYTSATGANWDDDDADFDPGVYASAAVEFEAAELARLTLANARDTLKALEPEVDYDEDDEEPMYPSEDTPARSQMDYNIDPEDAPTYADFMTELWSTDHRRRPAYIPLSFENDRVHPYQRCKYSANWQVAKLRMGANMQRTMIMAPSRLRMCKTWTSDRAGEYVEKTVHVGSALGRMRQVPTPPRLVFGSESESDDEVCTPPGSPSEPERTYLVEMEEYDPIVGGIDLPAHSIKAMKAEMGREFEGFSGIAEDFNVHQIFRGAEMVVGEKNIKEFALPASSFISTSSKANSAPKIAVTNLEATLATSSPTEVSADIAVATSMQLSQSKDDIITSPVDWVSLSQTTIQADSPDLKYIVASTNASLICNTVAAGWFAISSLPWAHIAVSAARALVDMVALVARH